MEQQEHPLRQYRRDRSLTLEQLAAQVSTTAVTISRIETGQQRAGHKLLIRLSKATGIPIEELLLASEPKAA